MRIIYWIVGLGVPFVSGLAFLFYAAKKYHSMDEYHLFSAHSYGFPEDISNFRDFVQSLYIRKISIFYVLLLATAAFLFLLPRIGQIVFYLSSLLLLFFCYGQYSAISICKRAMRGLEKNERLLFSPLLSLYRSALFHAVLLFTYFNLFFDLFFF